MRDGQIARLAGRQFNRISREQLRRLGLSEHAIAHRVATGRMVIVEQGVLALAPVLPHDDWGRWMAATLTAPGSVLSHGSAAGAWGLLTPPRDLEVITRPGLGGPRRHGGILVFRSQTLDGDRDQLSGIPITNVPRTLLDLAAFSSPRALARAVREAVRLGHTTIEQIADRLAVYRGRRGVGRLASAVAGYMDLPVERARSGAEVRALQTLRDAGRELPRLNVGIAGEEADLSWPRQRLIVEIDGESFHLDVGEDQRKQRLWEHAGWTVQRISSTGVYENPGWLLALAPTVPR